MGLLIDLKVADMKKKRRITMAKTIMIMAVFLASVFVPSIMNVAYEQGRQFAKDICVVTRSDLERWNETGFSGSFYGLEKTP